MAGGFSYNHRGDQHHWLPLPLQRDHARTGGRCDFRPHPRRRLCRTRCFDASRWARPAYAVSATFALYLKLFVLVVQSFLKVPALQVLAPTQTEAPFVVARILLLVASIGLGKAAAVGSRQAALPLRAARGAGA